MQAYRYLGMTAADIPRTNGQPDQGFEGNRFTGIPMYDALTHWDLSSADKASVMIPPATAAAEPPDDPPDDPPPQPPDEPPLEP